MRGEQGSSPQGVVAKGWLGPRRDSEESTARGRCGTEELRGEHLESLARSVAPSEGCPRRCTALDSGGRRGGGGRFGSDGRRKRGKRARTTALLLLHIGEACQQRVARRTWVIQDGVVPEQGARRELQRPRAARRVKHLPQRRRSAARQVHSAAAGELQSSRHLCSVRQHGRAHAVGASSCSPHGHQRVEGGRGGEERRRLQAQCGRVDEARVRCLVAASAARRARIASHRGGIASGSLHTAVRCPACQSRVCQPRHICACVLSVPGRLCV
mmetsp:Transcript_63798/g.154047  ORF Transcript_63798/g.154047 Transcript_63798/m.154047 type:complete len:271 (-) Transcript_63798:436-1248(-)